MSFFAKLGSGSDTDSDSGSESDESILSGDEGLEQDRKLAAKTSNKASMFLRSDDEDSDEESDDDDDDDDEDEDEDSDEEGGKSVSLDHGSSKELVHQDTGLTHRTWPTDS